MKKGKKVPNTGGLPPLGYFLEQGCDWGPCLKLSSREVSLMGQETAEYHLAVDGDARIVSVRLAVSSYTDAYPSREEILAGAGCARRCEAYWKWEREEAERRKARYGKALVKWAAFHRSKGREIWTGRRPPYVLTHVRQEGGL
jgi:hypothetical protein